MRFEILKAVAVEEARCQREERYLEMYTDDDGVVVIRGRLPQEVAALVQKGLEAAMDALKEEEKEKTRERVHAGGVRVEGQAPHGLVFHRPDGSVLVACPVRVPINGKAGETL